MAYKTAKSALVRCGYPSPSDELPSSPLRFPDGSHYRVEIPSTEGPDVMESVLDEANRRGVELHRISQGSGAMMLSRAELGAMAQMARDARVELSIFARPVAGWGVGAAARATGAVQAAQVQGYEGLLWALADVLRIAEAGIRGALVTDLGLLEVAAQARSDGDLPGSFIFKGSVQMGLANPASISLGRRLGLDTYNVPSDLALHQLAAIRSVTDLPIDIYIEAPDNLGGMTRQYEAAEIVRVAAPVYIKFGLRNAPDIYPSGQHLREVALAMGRERVRRAEIGLELLRELGPNLIASEPGAPGLGIPESVGA